MSSFTLFTLFFTKISCPSAINKKFATMRKRTQTESGSQYFTDDELIAYYNETKQTIQNYVEEIRRHSAYKSTICQTADGTIMDNRARLMDLYDSCLMQDAHLKSCMETLYSYVTGERYSLGTYDKEGKWVVDEEETKKVQTRQFEKFITGTMDAFGYGYTLFDISAEKDPSTGLPVSIGTIERRNVLPSQRRVVKRQNQWSPGWDLDDDKYKHNYILIDIQSLGLFATTTPLVLAKKYTVSNWVNFSHTYGQPIIHGKTTATDKGSRARLAQNIVNAAQNKVIVTGTDDAIDIKTFTMSNSEKIFQSLISSYANAEMSNLILGSESMAGATQSYVGSTKAHEDILRSRVKRYRRSIEQIINEKILPELVYWGFIKDGLTFKYSKQLDMSVEQKTEVFKMLTNVYEIPKESIENEFGITVGRQFNVVSATGSYSGEGGVATDSDNDHHIMSDQEYEKRYGHPRGTGSSSSTNQNSDDNTDDGDGKQATANARVNFLRGVK